MASIRMKVNTADLLEKVKASRAAKVTAYDKALAKWQEYSEEDQRSGLAHALEAELAKLSAGKLPKLESGRYNPRTHRYDQTFRTITVQVLMDPKPKLDTSREDRDIALLEMSSQDSISITADGEWSYYL